MYDKIIFSAATGFIILCDRVSWDHRTINNPPSISMAKRKRMSSRLSVIKNKKKKNILREDRDDKKPEVTQSNTVLMANELYEGVAEQLKGILTQKRCKQTTKKEVKDLFNNFLSTHVRVVKRHVMKLGEKMFKETDICIDDYVYNIDMKLTDLPGEGRFANKWVTWFQIRKSDSLSESTDKLYGLYAMREFKEGAYLGLYMGELVDSDTNANEEYQCERLRPDRDNPYMGMHFINDPIYPFYKRKYKCDDLKTTFLKKKKKEYRMKVNVNIMNDYLVKATKRIVLGQEIKTFYDWH